MPKRLRKFIFSFIISAGLILYLSLTCLAGIFTTDFWEDNGYDSIEEQRLTVSIGNTTNWQDAKAYKPTPVLFLHGFAKGNPADWNIAKSSLNKYFAKYQPIGTYLEVIDFQDPNGSVDTYGSGKTNPQGNSKGWADKVQDKVNELLAFDKYGAYTNKLNLVCHSMGGLAGRWYLANYSNNFVDKLILIGVPNKGSRLAKEVNALSKIPKLGWLTLIPVNSAMSYVRDNIDIITNILNIDIEGEAIDDLDISSGGSIFLNKLNDMPQPSNVEYFGIIGIWGGLANWFLFGDWYGGDWIVSKDSQLGTDYISLKDSIIIPATHFGETKIAALETDNKILKFLDSAPPEFEITSPSPIQTTTIYTSSVNIQGKVYKEYLPADTQLIINVTRQEDGQNFAPQISLLKASDLWIPKNPDSPVAEFDEPVNLPGNGTYKISCQLKNPSGLTSDIKDVWVKVMPAVTAIIVHCHNPEGKEIGSIQGVNEQPQIYDNDYFIANGANSVETHNKPIELAPGTHTIKAKFNGMTKEQTIALNLNETKIITFTFERINYADEIKSKLAKTFSRTVSALGVLNGESRSVILSDDDCYAIIHFYTWACDADISAEFQVLSWVEKNILYLQGHLIKAASSVWNKHRYLYTGWGAKLSSITLFTVYWKENIIILPSTCNEWFVQGRGGWPAGCLILRNNSDDYKSSRFGVPMPIQNTFYFTTIPPGTYKLHTSFKDLGWYSRTGYENNEEGKETLVDFSSTIEFELATFVSNVPYDLTGSAI